MMTTRLRRSATRARQIWDELDYAQRRVFELRTGVPLAPRPPRRHADRLEDKHRIS
jgi:hypothetical protein